MPTVARFDGLKINMYRDHNPPHVHVIVGDEEALVVIATGALLEGSVPAKKLAAAREYIAANREALMTKWDALQAP